MRGVVDLAQSVDRDVGVDLRRVQIRMSQERLQGTQVGPVLQHERRRRVAQHVAATGLGDPRSGQVIANHQRQERRLHRKACIP